MSRAAAGLAGLAVLGALTLAPASGPLVRGTRAAAAECLWQRHSKRVVKHSRRHGHDMRVARTRHWWICEEAPAPPIAAPAPLPTTPGAPPTEAAAEPEANRLSVTSDDKAEAFTYVLSHPSRRAGQIVVELDNQGGDPHNLNLQREGSEDPALQIPKTLPHQQQSASFDLPAGTYRLWCSLPTHDEKGMHATLVVEG